MYEEWRSISLNPNYAVSNYGRVVNLRRDYILKHVLDDWGYHKVNLGRNVRNKLVHLLVFDAFVQTSREDLEINHMDGDKDNTVWNLESTTPVENVMHAHRNGLYPEGFMFSPSAIRVVETGEIFESTSALARVLNVSPQAVSFAARNGNRVGGYYVERAN